MRISLTFLLLITFCGVSFSQSPNHVIKEINYSYEKVAIIPAKYSRKNVFVYGADNNKVQVLDFKKDSGKAIFDTVSKYNIVYDSSKSQVTQTAFVKKQGAWKKQGEVVTLYDKDKSPSEIQWRVVKKDKTVPHSKFTFSYDSLNRPKEILYDIADSTGKYKATSKLSYEYNRKGLKSCALSNMQDNKWVKLSVFTVMFDSMDMKSSLMKFKNGNKLDNQYYVENSFNLEKQMRTIMFKNYKPAGVDAPGKPREESYIAISYDNEIPSSVTAYLKDAKNSWTKGLTVKYTYGDAGHALNKVLKSYLNYDALSTRFNDFVAENYITDVNETIDGSKFSVKGTGKGILYSIDGAMLKYFAL